MRVDYVFPQDERQAAQMLMGIKDLILSEIILPRSDDQQKRAKVHTSITVGTLDRLMNWGEGSAIEDLTDDPLLSLFVKVHPVDIVEQSQYTTQIVPLLQFVQFIQNRDIQLYSICPKKKVKNARTRRARKTHS